MFSVQLFGSWALHVDGRPLQLRRQKARALLAYLLLEPRPHRRIALATLLWPDLDQRRALHNLSNAVLDLRKLVPDGEPLICDAEGDALTLGDNPLESDVTAFSAHEQRLLHHQHQRLECCAVCIRHLPALIATVNGPLLHDLDLDDCEDFNDWLLQRREQLHQRLTDWRKIAAQFAARRGDYGAAHGLLQTILQEEPWREEVLLEFVRVLCARGERISALRRLVRGIAQLRSVLNSEPTAELLLLADDLQAAVMPPPPAAHFAVPPLPTTVVSRALLEEVLDRFARQPQQLLTLLGLGGSGKTMLALSAAHRLRGCFSGGIALIHVEPDWDSCALLFALARAVGVATLQSDTLFEQLIAVLQRGNWLLIFDACEQTPHLSELLADLLGRVPDLSMLATSRVPLRLSRETLLTVAGFALDVTDRPSEAARFVYTRLAAVLPTVVTEYAAVERLCRAVGGLPLALELSVHLLQTQPLESVIDQVCAAPATLEAPLDDLPLRHQSVHTLLDSTWALIAAEHRPVLTALACLHSPFSLETIAGILGDRTLAATALHRFQLLGLVTQQALHPLVRTYIQQAEHLRETLAAAQLQHSRFFLHRLAAKEVIDRVVISCSANDDLAAQLPDVHAAWLTACNCGHYAELQAAAPGLARLAGAIGWYLPAIDLLQHAADVHRAAGHGDGRAIMVRSCANLTLQNGQQALAATFVTADETSTVFPALRARDGLPAAVTAREVGDRPPAAQPLPDEASLPTEMRAAPTHYRARTALLSGDGTAVQTTAE